MVADANHVAHHSNAVTTRLAERLEPCENKTVFRVRVLPVSFGALSRWRRDPLGENDCAVGFGAPRATSAPASPSCDTYRRWFLPSFTPPNRYIFLLLIWATTTLTFSAFDVLVQLLGNGFPGLSGSQSRNGDLFQ